MLKNLLLAGLGGFIGASMRYGSHLLFKSYPAYTVTFSINIIGSFIIGCIMALSLKSPDFSASWSIFLATGICGGFTTFSAFSYENLQMLQQGNLFMSLAYCLSSLFFGLLACYAGYALFK